MQAHLDVLQFQPLIKRLVTFSDYSRRFNGNECSESLSGKFSKTYLEVIKINETLSALLALKVCVVYNKRLAFGTENEKWHRE